MSLKLADTCWKVSATDKTVSGRTWRHGFGFSIQDFRGLSILSISYESERAAREASRPFVRRFKGQWISPRANRYL